jgi:hypothetical protein
MKEEMWGVIRFLFVEGVKPVEIIHHVQAQYGDNCLSCSKIYKQIEHFRKRRTSVCDEERSGRTSMSRTEINIQVIGIMVLENRQITVDDTVEVLNISHSSEHSILL